MLTNPTTQITAYKDSVVSGDAKQIGVQWRCRWFEPTEIETVADYDAANEWLKQRGATRFDQSDAR